MVLLGAAITSLTHLNLDGWLGLAVAVFIVVSGVKLIIETGDPLLGMAPDQELVKSIYQKILSTTGLSASTIWRCTTTGWAGALPRCTARSPRRRTS